jgi:ABC-type sulfate transport system permease component
VNDTLLRRAWTDSVWSKVIATGITAALAGLLGALAAWWRTLDGFRGSIFRLIDRPVTLPAWSLLALGCLIALVLWR